MIESENDTFYINSSVFLFVLSLCNIAIAYSNIKHLEKILNKQKIEDYPEGHDSVLCKRWYINNKLSQQASHHGSSQLAENNQQKL